jgi:transcriptional regulator with XRE-family HTH domain
VNVFHGPYLSQLACVRRSLGVSQADLAARTGFSQQYVSLLERGLRPTDAAHALVLAQALGVDPATLTAERITICSSTSGAVTVTA